MKDCNPAYNIFLQGMIFPAFSRYLLLSRRLQIKLKRLKPGKFFFCKCVKLLLFIVSLNLYLLNI